MSTFEEPTLSKMNPKLKKKWLAALRSGKYRRGLAQLKDGNRYCCLGVLCEVSGQRFDGDDTFLPERVAALTGVTERTQEVLASINDGDYDAFQKRQYGPIKRYREDRGAPFSSIADFIEKHL